LTDRIAQPWGTRTPYGRGESWPVRVDTFLEDGVGACDVEWYRSASILHSNGDALDIAVKDGRIVGVRGRADDRVNRGRLDPKDLFGSVYLAASGVSIDWTVLAQGAQAAKDSELLAVVTECHAETLRQLKWATSRLKEAAPQALTS
jgi:hypothetical protein